MFDKQLSVIKRYQHLAGIAGSIGFLVGIIIPSIGLLTRSWRCPFGSGILQTIGFLAITGFVSALIIGNFVALLLIALVKIKHLNWKPQEKKGKSHGNRDIRT